LKAGNAKNSSEWVELGLRAAFTKDACKIIETLYNDRELFPDNEEPRPLEICYKFRKLQISTLFGNVTIRRRYYHHKPSKTGRCPLDEVLSLEGKYSPALARLVCRAASMTPSFEQGSTDLHLYTGIKVPSRQFGRLAEKIAPGLKDALATFSTPIKISDKSEPTPIVYLESDGTGTPMRKNELVGRKGKQKDGSSKTREAKLGCVFTQLETDKNGEPVRDPASTSYVGTYHGCRDIAVLLRQEALRRDVGRAHEIVCLGDGAAWIWKNFEITFPLATQILDYYHASEYVVEIAKAIYPDNEKKATALYERWKDSMKEISPAKLILEACQLLDKNPDWDDCRRDLIKSKINYLKSHACRTQYGKYRAKGYFIGSGVIEAGCKTVVGGRLKQSGMFWSKGGAENILGMRCLFLGADFDRVWKKRTELKFEQRQKDRRWLSEAA